MTEDKLTIRLTEDQQKQIQEATGKKVTALNIVGYGPSALTEQDLDKVTGGTNLFEIEDYSFDIEQTLSIGSQSSGAGAALPKGR
jgi:hypothetical protein